MTARYPEIFKAGLFRTRKSFPGPLGPNVRLFPMDDYAPDDARIKLPAGVSGA